MQTKGPAGAGAGTGEYEQGDQWEWERAHEGVSLGEPGLWTLPLLANAHLHTHCPYT